MVRSQGICGIVGFMKALKSKLASQVLADPRASEQLFDILLGKSTAARLARSATSGELTVQRKDGQSVQVRATIVPKASKAL